MFTCEEDLLVNLIVLSPQTARKEFRYYIFNDWTWRCAYCDKKLDRFSATIDHIVPKFRGGHSVKSNMCCSCSSCNCSKGSLPLEEWYTQEKSFFSEERFVKLKEWMKHKSFYRKLSSSHPFKSI